MVKRNQLSLRASSLIWASEASLARTRERGAFYSAPRGFAARSRVLGRLVSLAQIGELPRRREPTLRIFCKEVKKQPTFRDATTGLISQRNDVWAVKQIFLSHYPVTRHQYTSKRVVYEENGDRLNYLEE